MGMVRRRFTFALLSALLLSGCGVPIGPDDEPDPNISLTKADVVGTWAAKDDRSFTFAADGTFTAKNVPYQAYVYRDQTTPPGFDPARDHVDDRGTWKLEPAFPGDDPTERLIKVNVNTEGTEAFPLGFNQILNSWRQPDGQGSLVLDLSGRTADPYVYLKK
jgi:hypothetical protein